MFVDELKESGYERTISTDDALVCVCKILILLFVCLFLKNKNISLR